MFVGFEAALYHFLSKLSGMVITTDKRTRELLSE